MNVGNDKTKAKVFIQNRVYVHENNVGLNYKEIRKINNNRSDGYELIGVVSKYGYSILNDDGGFDRVDYDKFVKYLSNSGYKTPVNSWSGDNKVLYSLEDYDKGVIKDGHTLSIALNELYENFGYEVVVIDLDLGDKTQEEYDKVKDLVYNLSYIRDVIKTPNGFHLILKKSEYEKLLNKLGINDVNVLSNNLSINGVSIKADIFRTWKDVRYIVIPTKGSIREMLGGGILRNGNVIVGNSPYDILMLFHNIHESSDNDDFINGLLSNIEEINNNDEFSSIQSNIVNKNGYVRKGVLDSFCKEVGIENLRDYDIRSFCRSISSIGNVDGTGRYNKLLKYVYYYVVSVLVKKSNSYKDLLSSYKSIDIYDNDDNLEVYNALKTVYPDQNQLKIRSKQFIADIDKVRDRIAQKLYESVYNAIKKHMNKTSWLSIYPDKIICSKEDTLESLAYKFHERGVRRYGDNIIVDGCIYYTVDEFKKGNRHINKAIPDSLSHFHIYLKEPEYEYKNKIYKTFKIIPKGRSYFYDHETKSSLIFVKDKDFNIYCIRTSQSGVFIEKINDLERPIFYRYYISKEDYLNFNQKLNVEDLSLIRKIIKNKDKAKEFLNKFVEYIFYYYTLSTSNAKYDNIIKHALVVSLLSDAGFLLQLIGQSGVGKTVLAMGLGTLASHSGFAGTLTLSDNTDENKYRILQNLYEGKATVIDEIPKTLDEKTQRTIFSVITSQVNDHRLKYATQSIQLYEQAKIITTSLDIVEWASDARRRSIIVAVARSDEKDKYIGLEPVKVYHNEISKKRTLARIALYSIISNVKLDENEARDLSKVSSIPDNLKQIVGLYFKAIGYDLNDVIEAFSNTNQSNTSLNPLFMNILEVLSSDNVKSFIKERTDIFVKEGGWHILKTVDLLRLLYANGMIKNESSDEYFSFFGNIPEAVRTFTPDPSNFKETFLNLLEGRYVNGVDFKEIDNKIVVMAKSRTLNKKIRELFQIPTSETEGYGIEIFSEYRKEDKRARNVLKIKYHNTHLDYPPPNNPPCPPDNDPNPPSLQQPPSDLFDNTSSIPDTGSISEGYSNTETTISNMNIHEREYEVVLPRIVDDYVINNIKQARWKVIKESKMNVSQCTDKDDVEIKHFILREQNTIKILSKKKMFYEDELYGTVGFVFNEYMRMYPILYKFRNEYFVDGDYYDFSEHQSFEILLTRKEAEDVFNKLKSIGSKRIIEYIDENIVDQYKFVLFALVVMFFDYYKHFEKSGSEVCSINRTVYDLINDCYKKVER